MLASSAAWSESSVLRLHFLDYLVDLLVRERRTRHTCAGREHLRVLQKPTQIRLGPSACFFPKTDGVVYTRLGSDFRAENMRNTGGFGVRMALKATLSL